MSKDFWEIVGPSALAVEGMRIGYDIYKGWMERKMPVSRAILRRADVHERLLSIPQHQSKHRMIMKAHNGGKPVNVYTPVFVSAMYEVSLDPFSQIKDEIQSWRIDQHYNQFLQSLIRTGSVSTRTSELPAAKLKSLYAGHGVGFGMATLIGETKDSLWYLLNHSTEEDSDGFDDATVSSIQSVTDVLATLLKTRKL